MTTPTKLDQLRKKADELKARIAAAESAVNAKARKEDTRQKVLIGAAFLNDVEVHPETRAGVKVVLRRAITAERDINFLKEKGWL
jgi:hypothetical protein